MGLPSGLRRSIQMAMRDGRPDRHFGLHFMRRDLGRMAREVLKLCKRQRRHPGD